MFRSLSDPNTTLELFRLPVYNGGETFLTSEEIEMLGLDKCWFQRVEERVSSIATLYVGNTSIEKTIFKKLFSTTG